MNAGGDGGDVRFQVGGGDSAGNCSSSVVDGCLNPMSLDVSVMAMSSMSTGKPLNLADPFFSSAWDPLFPLSHNETIGSSLVSHGEFVNMPYPMTNLDNQGVGRNCTAQLARYAFDSRLLHLGSGSFSDVIGSFGVPELNQMAHCRSLLNNSISNLNGEPDETVLAKGTQSRENRSSEDEARGSAPINRRRKRSPEPSSPYDPNKKIERENSDVPKTPDEKKQKIEEAESTKFAKPNTRQSKDDSSNGGEAAKENYIHVRARRGQATNSHSLAERVRREKISERMKMLQELVPGCNKITGKAVMLDEIINYVQSLQQQVEFLSMKLATLIPGLSIDVEKALSKETLYSHGGGPTNLGPHSGVAPSQLYSLGNFRGTLPILPSTSQCPLNQSPLDGELQTLYEMGFDSISGRLKLEQ